MCEQIRYKMVDFFGTGQKPGRDGTNRDGTDVPSRKKFFCPVPFPPRNFLTVPLVLEKNFVHGTENFDENVEKFGKNFCPVPERIFFLSRPDLEKIFCPVPFRPGIFLLSRPVPCPDFCCPEKV